VLTAESDRASGSLSDRAQTRFAVHGAPEAQPVVDGMNMMLSASNTGVFVYNQVNFQEVVAETSGVGPHTRGPAGQYDRQRRRHMLGHVPVFTGPNRRLTISATTCMLAA
jgi:hypothetical protein